MNGKEFDIVVEERLKKTVATLLVKAKEYRRNDDAMHNFDKAAQLGNTTREKALWGFALKHYVSFMDILDDMDKGHLPTESHIDEKIGDLINYLILCEASIKDKIRSVE
jgi:hypothetical protein